MISRVLIHPGEILREDALPALGLSAAAAATKMGVPQQELRRILEGKAPITHYMAARIGRLCGNGPGIWVRMQASHDANKKRRTRRPIS